MCNFRIGQEVVCVDDAMKFGNKPLPITKNQIYKIASIITKPCCEAIFLDVGFTMPIGHNTICKCGFKGVADGVWLFYYTRFAPLQTDSEEADMTEALEEVFSQPLFQ